MYEVINNLVPMTSVVLADNGYMGGYHNMMGYGCGWGFGVFGLIGMLLFWSLIIAAIVLVVKSIASSSKVGSRQNETPMDILEKRYAKGEISKEELEKAKADLSVK